MAAAFKGRRRHKGAVIQAIILVSLAVPGGAENTGECKTGAPEGDAHVGASLLEEARERDGTARSFTVAFGSCHHQGKPASTLLAAAAASPDAFIFLGDNLYNDIDRFGMPCEPLHCSSRHRALTSPLLLGLFELMPLALKRLAYHAFSKRHAAGSKAGHTGDAEALPAKYVTLGAKPEVVALRTAVPHVLATWDDHDYGRNDEGAGYAPANLSRAHFLRFWRGGDGAVEARAGRAGVYEAHMFGSGAQAVQILLLDLRSFRTSPLLRAGDVEPSLRDAQCATVDGADSLGEYCAHPPDAPATLLGSEQWAWLEAQLRVPAAVRLLCSSLAFASQFHGMEAWVSSALRIPESALRERSEGHWLTRSRPSLRLSARLAYTVPQSLFPAEQRRLVELLVRTQAEGVVVISGDVHYAELSVLRPEELRAAAPESAGLYPLYDLASSGLNQDWPVAPSNSRRLAGPVKQHNWGRVAIDWARRELELGILDGKGALAFNHTVSLDELRFSNGHVGR